MFHVSVSLGAASVYSALLAVFHVSVGCRLCALGSVSFLDITGCRLGLLCALGSVIEKIFCNIILVKKTGVESVHRIWMQIYIYIYIYIYIKDNTVLFNTYCDTSSVLSTEINDEIITFVVL